MSLSFSDSVQISDIPLVRPAKTLPFPSPLSVTLTLSLPLPAHLTTAYLRLLVNTVDVLYPSPPGPGKKAPLPALDVSPDVGRKLRRTRVEAWAIVEKLWREHQEEREKEATGKSKAERAEDERLRKKKEARDALSTKERAKVGPPAVALSAGLGQAADSLALPALSAQLEEKDKKKALIKQQKKLQKK